MENNALNNDQLLLLLEKYSRNQCTEAEINQIRKWYDELDISGEKTDALPGTPEAAALKAAGWQAIAPVTPIRKPFYLRPWFKAAAVVALIAGSTWGIVYRYQHQSTFISADASIIQRRLPDGTAVWLNKKSKLTCYPGDDRTVSLEGEAFFDVAKNPAHPFVIHTERMDITVLGTTFNVKAYKNDVSDETLLVSGAVEITLREQESSKIRLRPNEKIILHTSSSKQHPTTVYEVKNSVANQDSTLNETLWRENKLVFSHETFEQIAVKMERWYGVNIHIQDPSLKKLLFTAIFENETVDQTLTALQLSAPFHYQINQQDIFITK
ncbi:FecR family protein [Chitinophaga varians]|uniref:FecR family protein n=1 Tax=Chitinophaga varians TaxID=2202339 RepID=UPI00165F1D5C|nr:FecR domain-containing protein [Chitinophaga varians]MBC9913606.1 DUF4974 domain-containing protein [Chitinophaga varians]